MASLKNIKLKILSYKKTGTVTHAMEAVSAVKMRKGQERALAGRLYAATALSVLERLSATADLQKHPLMSARGGKKLFIIVTSDKGLAGALNSGVIRSVERAIAERGYQKEELSFIAIGRRGADYFASRGYQVIERHENVADSVSENDIRAVTEKVLQLRAEGAVGDCFVAYQNFISTFEQEPSIRQILPITAPMLADFISRIRPAKGRYAPSSGKHEEARSAVYTIEPDADEVLEVLLPKLLNVAIFHALLEAKASEHSARMVAMKSATDKAKEKAVELTRIFNKARQAAITREVSEITSGIEAMK